MDNFSSFSAVVPKHERTPRRDKNDIGLKKSDFISFVSDYSNHYDDNLSILTEQEKQEICFQCTVGNEHDFCWY